MTALDCIERLLDTKLYYANLRYCLVTDKKLPIKVDGSAARSNVMEDFVDIESILQCKNLHSYAGIGISIQASNICAIDVDHCFSKPFSFESIDDRAKAVFEMFKDLAYCEFSFSGQGMRILFKSPLILDYTKEYYIKNEKLQIEFYQPSKSFRYVTITGAVISDNDVDIILNEKHEVVKEFLNKYMKKPKVSHEVKTEAKEVKTYEELMKDVKQFYFKNVSFQNLWFATAPGSGKNESELDFQLMSLIYENITQDKDLLKQIFESSPYFKSKDAKHRNKWTYNNFRYFEYVYSNIRR